MLNHLAGDRDTGSAKELLQLAELVALRAGASRNRRDAEGTLTRAGIDDPRAGGSPVAGRPGTVVAPRALHRRKF
jgi:hypothetical protein